MKFFSVKNFDRYQHYTDRNPPWIKLHRSLLTDYMFSTLSDAQKAHIMLLWLLASQNENKLPEDPAVLTHLIGADTVIDLTTFKQRGFLVPWHPTQAVLQKWPSRYISRDLRLQVLTRDRYQCVQCSQDSAHISLEIDHKIPVSQGGQSILENLQTLCISCNRMKHNRKTDARQMLDKCKTDARSRASDSDSVSDSSLPTSSPKGKESKKLEGFDQFWAVYPRKVGKGAAQKRWLALQPSHELILTICLQVHAACITDQWRRNQGQFIPHPATWLNEKRWEDTYEPAKAVESVFAQGIRDLVKGGSP